MAGVPEEHLLATGARWNVAFAQWSRTDRTVSDWQSLNERVRIQLSVRFNVLCVNGTLPVPYQMRSLGDGITEFKYSGRPAWRIAAFLDGRTWFLTHIFKAPHRARRMQTEIQRTKRARDEQLGTKGNN